jgi:proline dehydrogenase
MSFFNKLLVFSLPLVPKSIVYLFAKRYIAGPTIEDAIKAIQKFNSAGMLATVDLLGEEAESKEDALKAVSEYNYVLRVIHEMNLNSNISLKPTHLGLKIGQEFCYENIRTIVIEAKKYNNFVRIDMEDHTCTADSIEIYLRLRQEYTNVGLVVQAYLRRTITDINTLIKDYTNIRLCKGIYVEPRKIAYKDKDIINDNFNYCLSKLLNNGCYVGIATHDEKLVWHALTLIDTLNLNKDQYEFQMLLGVSEELRQIIVSSGHRIRIYVPFGEHWHSYSMRRLKENPSIASYIIKHIFKKN